jgi:hypothetical protein
VENKLIVELLEKIFAANTDESKEAVVAVSRLLAREHLDESNAYLYLKIMRLNLGEASDAVFANRNPETFFSVLVPFNGLIGSCLEILTSCRPKELYFKNLLACSGIMQMTYKNPRYGFNVYRLSVNDIQHFGKYLSLRDDKLNDIIVDVLSDIWRINSGKYKDESLKAKEIVDCFFDRTKRLSEVIPEVILD